MRRGISERAKSAMESFQPCMPRYAVGSASPLASWFYSLKIFSIFTVIQLFGNWSSSTRSIVYFRLFQQYVKFARKFILLRVTAFIFTNWTKNLYEFNQTCIVCFISRVRRNDSMSAEARNSEFGLVVRMCMRERGREREKKNIILFLLVVIDQSNICHRSLSNHRRCIDNAPTWSSLRPSKRIDSRLHSTKCRVSRAYTY